MPSAVLTKKTESYINSKQEGKNIHEFDLDLVHNFDNYFPYSNIEWIVKNQIRCGNLEKDVIKHYLRRKYKNLKNYVFSVNPIMEQFLNEEKAIRRKRKSIQKDRNFQSSPLFYRESKTGFIDFGDTLTKKENTTFRIKLKKRKNYFGQTTTSSKSFGFKSFGDVLTSVLKSTKSSSRIKKI